MQRTSVEELLASLKLTNYLKTFQKYGVQKANQIFHLTPQDWLHLKEITPFHRYKILQKAAVLIQDEEKNQKKTNLQILASYDFLSNGPYNGNHKPQNLNTFQPEGYGLASCNNCFMTFKFKKLANVYGIIIGNNCQVSGGWGSGYLDGVQIQVKISGSSDYQTVHTIAGMPNAANTAYMAKIQKNNVQEIKMWKTSYFSTSYIRIV